MSVAYLWGEYTAFLLGSPLYSFTSDPQDGLWVLGDAAVPVLSPPRTGVKSEAKSHAFFPVSYPWVSWLSGDTSSIMSSFCDCLGGSYGPSNRLEAPRNPVPRLSLTGSTMLGNSWLRAPHLSPSRAALVEADTVAQMTSGPWQGNTGQET